MKLPDQIKKGLRYLCFIISALALQGGCVTIKDAKNRDNQIKNASKTYVEAYMARRVLENRKNILQTYSLLFRMQDSVQQSLRDVHTTENLMAASLLPELKEVQNIDKDPLAFTDYQADDGYSRRLGQLLQSEDVQKSSDELFRVISGTGYGNTLPGDYQALKSLAGAGNTFLYNLQEYLNKRALTASLGYRKLADVYRQKGMELHETVLRDKQFTMTDLERIETERMAEKYIALSLEFTEKSDSLLAAAKEAPNPWKAGAEINMKKHLRLQNLAQKR